MFWAKSNYRLLSRKTCASFDEKMTICKIWTKCKLSHIEKLQDVALYKKYILAKWLANSLWSIFYAFELNYDSFQSSGVVEKT